MKCYSLLLGFIIAAFCCNLPAQDKVGLQPNATVLSILQGSAGKTVELRLNSGEKIGGKIQQVTDNVVHLFPSDWRRIFRRFRRCKRHFGDRDSDGRQIAALGGEARLSDRSEFDIVRFASHFAAWGVGFGATAG